MKSNILVMQNLIDGFKFSCQTEGKSAVTVEWYVCFLNRFRFFLEAHHLPNTLNQIDKNHVKAFIRYLQSEAKNRHDGKPLSGATVQGYVRTLKAFFSWAYREEYTSSNFMANIPIPKAQSKVINTFSPEQIDALINRCLASGASGHRNLTIILLLLDTGIRVSELANIGMDDLNLTEGVIKIRVAKGNRERVVPIGSMVQKALWKYVHGCRPEPMTQKITGLFLSEKGTPLTKNGIQQLLRRYGREAGITSVRCSPHTFRHSFARNYLLNGGDIFSLQKILGHSSLASVRIYLNLFSVDIKKQHIRFSPVDNLAGVSNLHRACRASGQKATNK